VAEAEEWKASEVASSDGRPQANVSSRLRRFLRHYQARPVVGARDCEAPQLRCRSVCMMSTAPQGVGGG
jgi:hypothetical protein